MKLIRTKIETENSFLFMMEGVGYSLGLVKKLL